jgi:tRNA (cmo5U34)-methyltransferase
VGATGDSFTVMAQYHWDPDNYLALMHEEVPDYERLQDETAAAIGADARRVLELGTGTGETARRVLARHPSAFLVGLDASDEMLDRARSTLPADHLDLRTWRLTDGLPDGPFDVVFSALTIHHLDGAGKAGLFLKVAAVLSPGGRLVFGDVVVPEDPSEATTPIDDDYDKPSSVADQLRWLDAAGLRPHVAWAHRDLAVLVGEAST